jgi:Na+-driven multidrug efflux pump
MSGRQSRRRAANRAAFLLAVLLLILTSIGTVAFSPWMLRLASDDTLDWTRLSDIGQTYGAISAVVAANASAPT